MATLNVAIAGGGIAGLSTAVALGRQGHNVSVYESASNITAIGAGIQITPNASKILHQWGVNKHLPDLDRSVSVIEVRRWQNGKVIGRWDTERFPADCGAPYCRVHRGDLQIALLKVAELNGVRIHTGSSVVEYDINQPAIKLLDGRTVTADLIVDAAGYKSLARREFDGAQQRDLNDTGLAVLRTTIPIADIESREDLADVLRSDAIRIWVGPQRNIVVYRMRGEGLLNVSTTVPETRRSCDWETSEYANEMRSHFAGWDPTLFDIGNSVTKWTLPFDAPLSKIVSESAKFVLVGDAIHPIPPCLAQGAALAIEDAQALALSLNEESIPLEQALNAFQTSRLMRRKMIYELSLNHLQIYHLEDGEEQAQRDDEANKDGKLIGIWNNINTQRVVYGFEVV